MEKETDNKKSFLEGSIWDKMIMFVIPLVITSIIQQLFNTADKIIAGRFISENAYGAIGLTSTISNFFIEFFMGFTGATTVVIAKYIGMGKKDRARAAVNTAMPLGLFIGIFIAAAGFILTEKLLVLLDCPTELFFNAETYLKLYFLGMPFFMLYNFSAAVSRSNGNTKLPFYCLLFGGAVKLSVNMILTTSTNLGVAGFGIATIAANAVSSVSLIYFLGKGEEYLRPELKKIKMDKSCFFELLKIGLPSGFLNSVYSVSNLIMQRAINSLGADAVKANSAAGDIEIYIQFLGNAFAQAAITFTGQNYGAGNLKRCNRVTLVSLGLCNLLTVTLSLSAFFAGRQLLGIFGVSALVIEIAMTRMKFTMLFKFIQCVMDIMAGCLQGYGYTFVPAICTIIGVCGVRLLWIYTVFPGHQSLATLMFIYPVTQGIAALCHTGCYINVRRKIRNGTYGKIKG